MRTRLENHLASRQVAHVIYGSVIGLALDLAVQNHPPGAVAMIGWVLGTAVAVALADIYSEVLGTEIRQRGRMTRQQWTDVSEDGAAVAFGAGFSAVFFLLAGLGIVTLATAFTLAKWCGLGLISFYGYWAGRFAGATVARALLQAAVVALIGSALIALKAFLH